MAKVSKHHSKQEWKSHYPDHSWIGFLIVRDTVCVNNLLEHCQEITNLEVGRWLYLMVVVGDDLGGTVVIQLLFQSKLLLLWSPVVADEGGTLLPHHVESLVEGLLLSDEHLEDEDFGWLAALVFFAVIYFVKIEELLSELLLGTLVHVLGVFDLLPKVL